MIDVSRTVRQLRDRIMIKTRICRTQEKQPRKNVAENAVHAANLATGEIENEQTKKRKWGCAGYLEPKSSD